MFVSVEKNYPYFPNLEIKVKITPFESYQVEFPEIYKKYKGSGFIYKIDCLGGVSDLLPVHDADMRIKVYKMISGDCSDEELSQLLIRFYTTENKFKNYVDEVFINSKENLVRSIFIPLRKRINDYKDSVQNWCSSNRGKHLIFTHDYEIVRFTREVELPFLLTEREE